MNNPLRTLAAVALGLLTTTTVSAQTTAVPNGTFDTWITRSSVEVPQSWSTIDEAIRLGLGPLSFLYTSTTVAKDAGSRTGAFAAKIETKLDQLVGPVPGGAVLGSINEDDLTTVAGDRDVSTVGGAPFTARAANLQFYYKLTGPNALPDSAFALVSLTRTVNGTVQTIASAELRLLPATAYTLATIPLQYRSSLTPDSVHIAFASGVVESPTPGTILTVDDVTLNGIVAATQNPALAAALTVYPNPSTSGDFQLASPSRPTVATAPYRVTDATGRVVRSASAAPASLANGRPLELRGLPAGLYLLNLSTPEGPLTRKLVVQ